MRRLYPIVLASWMLLPVTAAAGDRLCDTRREDCRAPLLRLIANERQGIDVAFWFMQDSRYVDALISRKRAGVPVRVLVDPRANASKGLNAEMLDRLKTAGIPMRMKAAQKPSDILHWKMMLFAGQDVVEFSAANYTPYSFVPAIPYVNYIDEAVFYSDNPSLTNTFRTRYDNLWTDTTGSIVNYANISSTPQRVYGIFPQDPSLNFPPTQDFAVRAVARYARETVGIDVIMFRVPDSRHADAMISAKARGVAVRLIMEQDNYRDRRFLWHAYNVDRMYAAGIPVKDRKHLGLTHQKSVVLRGLGEVIFGSSNWSPEAADVEQEHNLFTSQVCRAGLWCDAGGWVWRWFRDQFVSKWNSANEYKPFVPSGPDSPTYVSPANGNTGVSTGAALTWQGGSWAHLYDVYLGTDPNNLPLVARDARLGSPEAGRLEAFRPATLAGSTTYYWRVVSRTMARLSRTGTTWRFTTGTGGLTLLAAPSGLTATVSSATQITLRWNDVSGETHYRVERSTTSGSGFSQIATVSANVTTHTDPGLTAGRTYYYRVRAATTSGVSPYSILASATPAASGTGTIVLHAAKAAVRVGAWTLVQDGTAAGGYRVRDPDGGRGTVTVPALSPSNYFELRFYAQAGKPYRLWMRGRADANAWPNDSVWAQFTSSVDASGKAVWRIGSGSGIALSVEECSACGLAGWGWHDNGWGIGVRGQPVYFAASGPQTIRIQRRQDGVSIDQIVLSPTTYFQSSPGLPKNDTTVLPATP